MILNRNQYTPFFVIGLLFGDIEETLVWGGTSLQLDSETLLQGITRCGHPELGVEVIANRRSLKMDIEAKTRTMLLWARLEDKSRENDEQVVMLMVRLWYYIDQLDISFRFQFEGHFFLLCSLAEFDVCVL